MLATAQPATFVIADISGYTGYLADVELDHAQDILADLIGAVVTRAATRLPAGQARGRRGVHLRDRRDHRRITAPRHRRALLLRLPTPAPRRPAGDVVRVQRVQPHPGPRPQVRRPPRRDHRAEGRGAAGAARVGRDRRPSAAQERGRREARDPGVRAVQPGQPGGGGPRRRGASACAAHVETYDRIGEVQLWVHDLEARWAEEEARARVFVTPEEASVTVTVSTPVPPQVAWEFLTTPGQRMTWQPWVTEVNVEGATGGRRGPGSANHCRHGKDAVIEEILDWRPYDYVTDRTILDTPTGPVKLLHTIELEPVTGGTTIHMRFGAPKTKREKELMDAHRPRVRGGPRVRRPEPPSPARGAPRDPRDERAAGAGAHEAPRRWPAGRDHAAGDDRLSARSGRGEDRRVD